MHFTINDIREMAPGAAFERGMQYFHARNARITDYFPEQSRFIAQVQGTGRQPYQVTVTMDHILSGDCTCPVGFDCKHAVAAALQWLADYGTDTGRVRKPSPNALQQWLRELPVADEEQSTEIYSGRHYLLYELTTTKQQVRLVLKKAYLKKDGQWSQINPFSPDYFSLQWNRPAHLMQEDVAILQLLPHMSGYTNCEIVGEAGRLALDHMLHTGRLMLSGRQVKRSAPEKLQIGWQEIDSQQQLKLVIAGRSNWLTIATTPPFYLDLDQAEAGELITEIPPRRLAHLQVMPPVPASEMPELAMHLREAFTDQQLPVPIDLPEMVTASVPTPCLDIVMARVSDRNDVQLPVALLHFDYAGQTVMPPYDFKFRLPQNPVRSGDKLIRISRDIDLEDRSCTQIYEIGLNLEERVGGHDYAWLPYAASAAEVIEFWQQFIRFQVPMLKALGWQVHVDNGAILDVTDADFTFQINEESNQWFELALSLPLSDGRSLNTTEAIALWLQQGAPDQLLVNVGSDWVRVDTRPLATVRDLITDLFNQKQLDKPIKLPAFQIARLQELPELDLRSAPLTRQLLSRLQSFQGIESVPVPSGLKASLRPYQQEGFNWLAFLQSYQLGGILADDMGLGKTLQALALLQHMKVNGQLDVPALILAPTSLTGNWLHEAARFTPQLRVLLVHGPDRAAALNKFSGNDVVITTYPLLPRDFEHYKSQQFSVIILDEAQAIKNPTTKISMQVRQLKGKTRICLTGTPLENHLGELWSLMDFALPGLLGGRKSFQQQFRTPIEKHADATQQKVLLNRVAPFMLRRTKTEVVKELPPKTEIVQYVELEGKQRALYESIRVSMEKRIRDLVAQQGMQRSHIQFLDALLKLRQACIDPRLVKLESATNIREHAKLEWLTENLPQLLEEGRHVLIFSQFTEVLALIEAELFKLRIDYCKLTGQTRKRQEVIDRFQKGDVGVFLISLKAGGSGLNLTAADVVIHMDPWWNPAVENQATDRAYRIGQDKPVFVYKLVAANTVEERIQQMQLHKQALADSIFDEEAGNKKTLDQAALLELLSG